MGDVLSMGIVRLYYVKSDREQLWVRCRESLSPYQFCNYITTTGATSGVGTAYLSGATEEFTRNESAFLMHHQY
jgi:hypothetical protein